MKRVALAVLAALALAGCGGGEERGTASLWVTRDRGAEVLLVRDVPAGLTVLQALDREVEVETRYGGRFVQAIDGLEGSLAGQRDWFFFVNGYEADRGAAEYRLGEGDIAWWDFRTWRGSAMRVPVVVGAFPEPFLHGYGGKTRPAAVRYGDPAMRKAAEEIGELIGADSVEPRSVPTPDGANVLELVAAPDRFAASADTAGGPVRFVIGVRVAERLVVKPDFARFRYEGAP